MKQNISFNICYIMYASSCINPDKINYGGMANQQLFYNTTFVNASVSHSLALSLSLSLSIYFSIIFFSESSVLNMQIMGMRPEDSPKQKSFVILTLSYME